jgi:hypothetical protein
MGLSYVPSSAPILDKGGQLAGLVATTSTLKAQATLNYAAQTIAANSNFLGLSAAIEAARAAALRWSPKKFAK